MKKQKTLTKEDVLVVSKYKMFSMIILSFLFLCLFGCFTYLCHINFKPIFLNLFIGIDLIILLLALIVKMCFIHDYKFDITKQKCSKSGIFIILILLIGSIIALISYTIYFKQYMMENYLNEINYAVYGYILNLAIVCCFFKLYYVLKTNYILERVEWKQLVKKIQDKEINNKYSEIDNDNFDYNISKRTFICSVLFIAIVVILDSFFKIEFFDVKVLIIIGIINIIIFGIKIIK